MNQGDHDSSITPQVLDDYQKLSISVAPDYSYVQGGGGNVSIKTIDRVVVKASGTRLSEATPQSGYVLLDRITAVNQISRGGSVQDSLASTSPSGRASIEAPLHVMCGGTYVAHVHSAGTIALGLTNRGGEFARVNRWELIPYVQPGEPLLEALMASESFKRIQGTAILGNHGLLAWAPTLEECVRRILDTENRCREIFTRGLGVRTDSRDSFELLGDHEVEIDFVSTTDQAWLQFVMNNVLMPDQAVLLAGVDLPELLVTPTMMNISGLSKDRQEMLKLLHMLGHMLTVDDCVQVLTDIEIAQVLGLESEKYRQGQIK